jgi:antitoxin component of MazEF toxin-antitoxin module
MTIEVKTKKWGNSIGIIIPREAVERFNIKPEERLVIDINKGTNVLAEMFGKARFKKRSAKEMLSEFRKKNPESKWL